MNWLFLKVDNKLFSFIYKIKNPVSAVYNKPFECYMSFIVVDPINEHIKLNESYEVLRGMESIGTIKLINILE